MKKIITMVLALSISTQGLYALPGKDDTTPPNKPTKRSTTEKSANDISSLAKYKIQNTDEHLNEHLNQKVEDERQIKLYKQAINEEETEDQKQLFKKIACGTEAIIGVGVLMFSGLAFWVYCVLSNTTVL